MTIASPTFGVTKKLEYTSNKYIFNLYKEHQEKSIASKIKTTNTYLNLTRTYNFVSLYVSLNILLENIYHFKRLKNINYFSNIFIH